MDSVNMPGYRFYPTEDELILFYLRHKLDNTRADIERVIPVLNVCSYHPRDLQSIAGVANTTDEEQWFFFCPMQQREAQGGRPTRTTSSGYWKGTGSPSYVYSNNKVVGVKRTLVFYQGKAPGTKTQWKMNEYKALQSSAHRVPAMAATCVPLRHEFSLCRVYIRSATLHLFDRRPISTTTISCSCSNPNRELGTTTTSEAIDPLQILNKTSNSNGSSSGDDDDHQSDPPSCPADFEMEYDWNFLSDLI